MVKKSYLIEGVMFVLAGIAFILAGIFTESVLDGLLWGFGGGALVPGIGMIIKYYYWSSPKKEGRYREIQELNDINFHDELNEKLRDKSGRIAYSIGLLILCVSEVVFSVLGKLGVITEHKVIVLYLFGLITVQIIIGYVVFHQLRKWYSIHNGKRHGNRCI